MRPTRLMVCAALVVAGIVATAAPASAYNLTTLTGASGVQCSPGKFSSGNVTVVLHLGESRAGTADQTAINDAVYWVNSEIGFVGGSTAYIGSMTTTYDPFTFGSWFGDTTPTIHVGFSSSLGEEIGGQTKRGPFTVSACTYNEAQIVLPDVVARTWDFGTPGWDYFQATETGASSKLWFRPVYLHELLHAFGLEHTSTDYANMNYGIKPWANRPANDMMKPLPDDVKALIIQMWPADSVDRALQIAWRESNYRNDVYNGSCCYGVFQINAKSHQGRLRARGLTTSALLDPKVNIEIALEIFQEQGWGPWGG